MLRSGLFRNHSGRRKACSVFFRAFVATLWEVLKFANSCISKTAIHTEVHNSALERGDYSGKKSFYQQGGNRQYLRSYSRSKNRKFALSSYIGFASRKYLFSSYFNTIWHVFRRFGPFREISKLKKKKFNKQIFPNFQSPLGARETR